MSKEVLNKKSKLVPVPTDKPLSIRLGIAIIGCLVTFIIIAILTVECLNPLREIGIEVGFEPLLCAMNIISAVVVGIVVFIFESEGSYKRSE